jgi:predicted transcriptional regulator
MSPRCETIGRFVLPVFRSLVAKELIGTYHLTQVEAAQKLGTTQAAISQYVNSKRALKGTEKYGNVMPQLRAIASKTASRLAKNNARPDQVEIDFCGLCPSFCSMKANQSREDYVI